MSDWEGASPQDNLPSLSKGHIKKKKKEEGRKLL